MSAKRGDEVPSPFGPGQPPPEPTTGDAPWELRFLTSQAASGWDDLHRSAHGQLCDAYVRLRLTPLDPINRRCQHQLKGSLSTQQVRGKTLPQWQYEVTHGGRIWYCPDVETGVVWIALASAKHPKQTQRRR